MLFYEEQPHIFTGLHRVPNENTEDLLRCFLYNELGVDYKIEFGNVHRFRTRGGDNRRAPIMVRFLYHVDLESVLSIANRLTGTQYGIREQFPQEIENRRKQLYPVMRRARQVRRQVTLVRDRLYIDNELYVSNEIDEDVTPREMKSSETLRRESTWVKPNHQNVNVRVH